MTTEEADGASLELEVAGQKANLRNIRRENLGAVLSVATFAAMLILGYAVYVHAAESKDASKELVIALREMTQAAREQNCLISLPIERRDPDLCRRLSR